MRLRTAVLLALALLVLAAGGALWWLYASREALIKRAIEHYGPEYAGVSVKVASVKLDPLDGRGAISGLEVGNPPGFSARHALSLGEVRLAVDPATLTSRVVRVRELVLDAPQVNYERSDKGDNLSVIQKNIESRLPRSRGGEGKAQPAEERRFIVDRVQVRNAKVSYGSALTTSLPDLQFRDLGKKTNGATAAELAQEIWSQLRREALARAPAALEGLRDRAKETVDSVRGLFK
jgi:hypothetical protein